MKALAISAVCLVVLVLIGLGVWGFVSWQNGSAKNLAVAEQGKAAGAMVAAGQAQAAQAAQQIVVTGEARDRLDIQVHQDNTHAIETAPGASQPLDPALVSTINRGLCKYPSLGADPECARLLAAHPK